tara:strand:+ start:542 stop:2083 length:1542 start_codon:yes stop_codon:yes gene_type:complete
MEDILNHSYNTRSKRVYKIDMNNGGNTHNYNKPKFIVDLSGEKRVTKTSADYKIVINSLVDLSNKLIQRRALEIMPENDYGMPDISDTDSDDSDYKPEKTISSKCSNSKYIKYSKNENKYFLSLELKEQQNIKILEKKIRTLQNSRKPLRFKILELESLSNESKYNIIEKIEQLKKLDRGDNEYFKLSSWINWLDKLPFNNYTNINVKQNSTAISDFLLNAKNIMDKAVYGHYEAKDQIIINMAKMITNDQSRGACIAIQGPMGNGKTTLVKEGICKALNRPFGFISLGGMQDANFMLGHDYTYEGSKPGRIAEILSESGCMNPVIYFDELDKISETSHGEEIGNLLCHLTDFSQNSEFQDKYLSGVKIDLSKVIFIFSYNDVTKINPILLDRMYKISTKGFNVEDKLKIATNYLVPTILKEYKLSDISFDGECVREIIHNFTEGEEGVRNLRRCIETIISKINVLCLVKNNNNLIDCSIDNLQFPLVIKKHMLSKLIKKTETGNDIPQGLYT